jgi:hypothetical protein
MEFGGGLGDVYYQLYAKNVYNVLWNLGPHDTATVWLVCLNPYAAELFTSLPTADRIDLRVIDYGAMVADPGLRKRLGMPPHGITGQIPAVPGPIRFPVTPQDTAVLDPLTPGYVVLAAGAGTPDRTIDGALFKRVIGDFLLQAPGRQLVLVGRNFAREGREEPSLPTHARLVNLVDQLTAAGSAQVVQKSAGLITAHSALNLLGWLEHKPQLLLYPQAVLDRHARNGRYDQWMFGADRQTTVHGLFERYDTSWMLQFLQHLPT